MRTLCKQHWQWEEVSSHPGTKTFMIGGIYIWANALQAWRVFAPNWSSGFFVRNLFLVMTSASFQFCFYVPSYFLPLFIKLECEELSYCDEH